MSDDRLKKDAIHLAAVLVRGEPLSELYRLCETQDTISAKKVFAYLERNEQLANDCAYMLKRLVDQLPPNV